MTATAEFTLPPTGFPLGRIFEEYPTVRLRLDCVVPTHDMMLPYFWLDAPNGKVADILRSFETYEEIQSVELLDNADGRALFQTEWDPNYFGLMEVLARTEVTVLSASGSTHGWLFELRATDRSAFTSFQQKCQRRDIPVSLAQISSLSELSVGTVHCLTPEQRAALELAYLEGYYDDPRETNLESLAEQIDISRQALAARLRRGYRALIEQSILYHDSKHS
ncbi:helix-turn-helix domain-containing protein [Halovenus sp. HT40]|uniref:helix-turn-helix domain-containing protein n=1 Tax=Halovenus sp. HT40 TaxID=3126691 RepID=UPI00300ED33F